MKRQPILRLLSLLLLLALTAGLVPTVSAQQQWNMTYFLKKYSDPHFDLSVQPNRVMSVEEFIAVIYAYSYYGDGVATVTAKDRDGNLPSSWAAPYVQAEVNKKVVDPGSLRWSQPATLAFAAEYLSRAKGKYSFDAVNFYSFTGTENLTAEQKLYLSCAVDWNLISYTPNMNVSAPIYRKDAQRYEVPTGNLTCRATIDGSTNTMREQHGYFVDCYWDLEKADRQFAMLQSLKDDVTMVTFQCAYWNGTSDAGPLTCSMEHAEAVLHSDKYSVDPQLTALDWCRRNSKLTFLGVSNAINNGFVDKPVRAALGGNMEQAADEIVAAVTKYGLDGVNMGIELSTGFSDLQSAYTRFLTLLAGKLHAKGKLLLTTVGAYFKESEEQSSIYDYTAIGGVSDYIHVILYDDYNDTGYPYRKTDGPISDFTRFGRCLRYATVKIPHEKLLVGLGAYATDYDLTAVTAEDIPLEKADGLRKQYGAEIKWHSEYAGAYFDYSADGHSHRVWQETAASISARVKYAHRFDVCGMSYYYIGTNAPQLYRAASGLSAYKPEVMSALSARIIPNSLRKSYGAPITRREFCVMIATFLKEQHAAGAASRSVTFSDCADEDVLRVASYGIVNGYTDGTFRPNNTISRQEAATMLMRLAKCIGVSRPNGQSIEFKEYGSMQSWAVEGVRFISACVDPTNGKHVMNGTGKNTFSPLASYTREQTAMTIIRLYNSAGKSAN